MKRLAVFLALLALVLAPSIHAADAPSFRLGFATLASLIPDVVGQPLEEEHHNPANGDSLQQTTTGLMVWRKADNWTAFTDGYWTWVNGPYGVQVRSNGERFAWEAPAARIEPSAAESAPPVTTPATASAAADAVAELAALEMINRSRREIGVGPLVMDEALRAVARAHARDMSVRNYFGHTNPEGQEPWDRARAAGVEYGTFAENIGWSLGYASPTEGVSANHRSMMAETPPDDGHRVNILHPKLKRAGIGIYTGADGRVFYVADFAG